MREKIIYVKNKNLFKIKETPISHTNFNTKKNI